MSQNADCPYCGSGVSIDHVRVGYDEKVTIQCRNCGGQFEYMPGFGSFSLPGEGPRTQRQVRPDESYSSSGYQGDPWATTPSQPKKSGCGTCCTICCCCLLLPTVLMVTIFGFFGGFFWWIFG